MRYSWHILLAGILLIGLGFDHAFAARIGVASVVKNQVTGSAGGRTRTLRPGAGVFQNETVSHGHAKLGTASVSR